MEDYNTDCSLSRFHWSLAGMVYLGLKLLAFQRWADEQRYVPKFAFWFALMLVVMSIENGMVW